jgi:hypothetical protein
MISMFGKYTLPLFVFVTTLSLIFSPWANAETVNINIFSIYASRATENTTITWKTDPETKGRIEYADESGTWQSTPWEEGFTPDHSITLLNLLPNTTYIYRINAENRQGELKTKTDNFTTVNSQSMEEESDQSSNLGASTFNSVLTPYVTPTIMNYNNYTNIPNYNAQVLGQQVPQNAPYFQNIIPLAIAPPASTPIPTDTPTPTPIPATSFLSNNSNTLIIGILAGLAISLLVYQFVFRENAASRFDRTKKHGQKHLPPRDSRKYRFSIGQVKTPTTSAHNSKFFRVGSIPK